MSNYCCSKFDRAIDSSSYTRLGCVHDSPQGHPKEDAADVPRRRYSRDYH